MLVHQGRPELRGVDGPADGLNGAQGRSPFSGTGTERSFGVAAPSRLYDRAGVARSWCSIRSSKPAGRRSPALGRFDSCAASSLSEPTYDRDFWERLGEDLERACGSGCASTRERASDVRDRRPETWPGPRCGCGHGSDALWLAAHGWARHGGRLLCRRSRLRQSDGGAAGPDLAARIDWVEADLAAWTPAPDRYDLVASLYVHIAGSVGEMVRRLAAAVAPDGTLLLVGHQSIDPSTGDPTPRLDRRRFHSTPLPPPSIRTTGC